MIKWLEKEYKVSLVITIIGAILIFYLSSLTFEGTSYNTGPSTIIYHFLAFFLFAFFLQVTCLKGNKRTGIFFLALVLSILYGVLDEFHQFFVPGRIFSIFDMFINSLGILCSSAIYAISIEVRKGKKKSP